MKQVERLGQQDGKSRIENARQRECMSKKILVL
jgi:hypothetical protein